MITAGVLNLKSCTITPGATKGPWASTKQKERSSGHALVEGSDGICGFPVAPNPAKQ